jgi:hypothetical protein
MITILIRHRCIIAPLSLAHHLLLLSLQDQMGFNLAGLEHVKRAVDSEKLVSMPEKKSRPALEM